MENQRLRNGLLFVIALCLVLIVLKIYSGDFVRDANAQVGGKGETGGSESHLYGCSELSYGLGDRCNKWVPVLTLHNKLQTTSKP